jgi:hypothetical protein
MYKLVLKLLPALQYKLGVLIHYLPGGDQVKQQKLLLVKLHRNLSVLKQFRKQKKVKIQRLQLPFPVPQLKSLGD